MREWADVQRALAFGSAAGPSATSARPSRESPRSAARWPGAEHRRHQGTRGPVPSPAIRAAWRATATAATSQPTPGKCAAGTQHGRLYPTHCASRPVTGMRVKLHGQKVVAQGLGHAIKQ